MDKETHWEYICTYVDDLLVMSKDPKTILDDFLKTFNMKGPYTTLEQISSNVRKNIYFGDQRPTSKRS